MTQSDEKHNPRHRPWDRALLFGAALLVVIAGCGSFLIADIYHVRPVWVFLGWNSIALIPAAGRQYRGHFRKPSFVAFFVLWMVIHGAVVVSLMRWVHVIYWIPLIGLELFLGFLTVDLLFGIKPRPKNQHAEK